MNESDIEALILTSKIHSVKSKLPMVSKQPRKNLFEILKVQNKEIRNSNILAYFFNPNEDHGFDDLFYRALKDIVIDKITDTKLYNDINNFGEITSVKTEESTKGASEKAKSIDIVLEGNDWVIGIENKINHHLNNPLNIYWEHLESKEGKTPFGILLTLFPYSLDRGKLKNGNYFLNITHKELIDKVQQNITLTGTVNSLDIFYLQEYFKSIEKHYYNLKNRPKMNHLVKEIAVNHQDIREIIDKKNQVETYIDTQLTQSFTRFNYEKANHWYRRKDKEFDLYFFLPNIPYLIENDLLRIGFEVRNLTNQDKLDKEEFKTKFKKKFIDRSNFDQYALKSDNQKTQAFIYNEENFFTSGKPFNEKFDDILNMLIGDDDDDDVGSPVKQVEHYLKERNFGFSYKKI